MTTYRSLLTTLLKDIYDEIDMECIQDTDTVKMITVQNILLKYGANPEDVLKQKKRGICVSQDGTTDRYLIKEK